VGKSRPTEAEAPGLLFMDRLLFEVRKRQDGINQYWRDGSFKLQICPGPPDLQVRMPKARESARRSNNEYPASLAVQIGGSARGY
jgi:hypothetical protein